MQRNNTIKKVYKSLTIDKSFADAILSITGEAGMSAGISSEGCDYSQWRKIAKNTLVTILIKTSKKHIPMQNLGS